jgi:hypothetical protein
VAMLRVSTGFGGAKGQVTESFHQPHPAFGHPLQRFKD